MLESSISATIGQFADLRHRQRIPNEADVGTPAAETGNAERRQELGVIENVEELGTKLEIESFGNVRVLQKSHVPVIDSGTMEEAPVGITFLAQGRRTKGRGD